MSARDDALHVKAAYERDPHDFYVEEPWCVDLPLDHERFIGSVWDPACGIGTIPERLALRGHADPIIATDLIDRGYGKGGVDLLTHAHADGWRPDNIITNPPYRNGVIIPFIQRCLDMARLKVAVVVQQQFPFSIERHDLFDHVWPVARIYYLSSRPSMPPGEMLLSGKLKAKGGKTDYLWIVFDWDHKGPPTAHWLRRAPTPAVNVNGGAE